MHTLEVGTEVGKLACSKQVLEQGSKAQVLEQGSILEVLVLGSKRVLALGSKREEGKALDMEEGKVRDSIVAPFFVEVGSKACKQVLEVGKERSRLAASSCT